MEVDHNENLHPYFHRENENHLWAVINYHDIVKVESYSMEKNRIYGWIKTEEYNISKLPNPWDYSLYRHYHDGNYYSYSSSKSDSIEKLIKRKQIWVKKWIKVTKILESKKTDIESIREEIKDFESISHKYVRINGDSKRHIIDGASLRTFYPAYTTDDLVDEKTRISLTNGLHRLAAQRKDFQSATSIVEDIIDPDLCPRLLNDENITDWKKYKRNLMKGNSTDPRDLKYIEYELSKYNPSEAVKIRRSYQWIPSDFCVEEDGSVKIKSRIHNLPNVKENETLYQDIAKVFESMVPMFKRINLIKEGVQTNLQVIVKAQSYHLGPGMKYSGRWHVEGNTENIVANGVYYCHIDPEITGGRLKFRPKEASDYEDNEDKDVEVNVEQGSCVVFSNDLPHRFRMIENSSQQHKQTRTFLNFFVIDPSKPIASSNVVPSLDFLRSRLILYSRSVTKQQVPIHLIEYMLSFLPDVWVSIIQAKKFRAKARETMRNEKSGWGYIMWGNDGTIGFCENYSIWDREFSRGEGDEQELKHTDSENGETHFDVSEMKDTIKSRYM